MWLQTLCSIEAGAVSLKSHVYEGGRVPGMLKTPRLCGITFEVCISDCIPHVSRPRYMFRDFVSWCSPDVSLMNQSRRIVNTQNAQDGVSAAVVDM